MAKKKTEVVRDESAVPSSMTELGKKLAKLKARKKTLEADVTKINIEITKVENVDLPKLMEDTEIDKFSIKGVGTISLGSETYVSVLKDNRPALFKWLREQGHGPLVVDWVFPNTLQAFVKEQLEAASLEGGHELPEYIKVTLMPIARIRKSK